MGMATLALFLEEMEGLVLLILLLSNMAWEIQAVVALVQRISSLKLVGKLALEQEERSIQETSINSKLAEMI